MKSDLEKSEILGILSYGRSKDKGKDKAKSGYKLLPMDKFREKCECWTKDICNAINEMPFDVKYNFAEGDEKKLEKNPHKSIENIFKPLSELKIQTVKKIYLSSGLPTDYVRFNGNVILRTGSPNGEDEEECLKKSAKNCLSSIEEGLELFGDIERIKKMLLEKKEPVSYQDAENDLNELSKICALSAKFTPNRRPVNGKDNDIWNELLQNANDHIPKDAKDKTLYIEADCDKLVLKYADRGFSIRDFLAVSTSGNSGNADVDEAREGRKGTGFKSIYNVFDKVIIHSKDIECTLEDCKFKISIDKKEKVTFCRQTMDDQEQKEWEQEKLYYPIPQFKKSDSFVNQTVIELYWRNKTSGGFIESVGLEKQTEFIKKKVYLFLDNIQKIDCKVFDKEYLFDKEEYISKNYFACQKKMELPDGMKGHNPYWENRHKNNCPDPVFEEKKRVTILFPVTDEAKIKVDEEVSVYCTLPIEKFKLKIPFYVNIPLLELNDSREDLAGKLSVDQGLGEWNKEVLKAALTGTDSAFFKIFSDMSKKENGKINLENLYQYIPYEYLDNLAGRGIRELGISWKECLMSVPFIRTTTNGESYKAYCLKDWAGEKDVDDLKCDKFVFLPKYMYWWFGIHGDLDGFSCEISFVFYNDLNVGEKDKIKTAIIDGTEDMAKIDGSVEKLKSKIQDNYPHEIDDRNVSCKGWSESEKNMLRLKRKSGDGVGKILSAVKTYIKTKVNNNGLGEEEQYWFFLWLKVIKKLYFESLNEVGYSKEEFQIFESFFYQEIFFEIVSYFFKYCKMERNVQIQCIENRKTHERKDITLKGYENIYEYVVSMSWLLEEADEKEKYMIKCYFENLLESPYIKFQRQPETISWEPTCKLQDDSSVRDYVKLIKDADGKEFLIECTEELFEWISKQSDEESEERIKGWIKNGLLYGKTAQGKVVPLMENTYFSDKTEDKIEHDHVIYVGNKNVDYKKYLKNLDDEITKPQFYKNAEIDFIKAVIERYKKWIKGAKEFVSNESYSDLSKEEKEIFVLLIKKLIKNNELILWKEGFEEAIQDFSQKDLCDGTDDRPIFEFKYEIRKIPNGVKDKFKKKVSDVQKNKLLERLPMTMTLDEFANNYVYLIDCHTGNKSLYCWAEYNYVKCNPVIVLFGENAFGTMLREQFDCNEYSENRVYEDMTCVPVDSLIGWNRMEIDENGVNEVREYVEKIVKRWEKEGNKEWLKSQLINRFDLPYEDQGTRKWINARGYGGNEFFDKKCPICGATLIAEGSLVKIGYITYEKGEKNIHLPMLMCESCDKSFRYAEQVSLRPDKEDLQEDLQLTNTDKKKMTVVFDMYAKEAKEMDVEVTFLNRWIWHILIH